MASRTHKDLNRCPQCGGLNATDADWCGQCGVRFRAVAPSPALPAVEAGPGYLESLAEIVGADEGPDREGMERLFELSVRRATWSCASCGEDNEMAASACTTCGTPFRNTARYVVEDELARRRRERESAVEDTLGAGAAAAAHGGPLAIPLAIAAIAVGVLKAGLRRIVRRSRR